MKRNIAKLRAAWHSSAANYDNTAHLVTCGADSCVFRNACAEGHVPALQGLNVIDTCGAGDIFGGSAMWKVLCSGKAPETLSAEKLRSIVRFATAAAGLSTERSGGISSIPALEEVMDAIS